MDEYTGDPNIIPMLKQNPRFRSDVTSSVSEDQGLPTRFSSKSGKWKLRTVDNGLQSDCEAMRKVKAEDLKTCGSHFNNFRPTNHSLRGFDGFPPGANIPVVRVVAQSNQKISGC